MKSYLGWSVCRVRRDAAFTLIELLTVMAIILVLAGLIINIAGSAQYNSAKSRATAEIHGLEVALESYKADNGAYPTDSYATEVLDPQVHFDPTTTTVPSYINSSEFLYQTLSGFPLNIPGGQNNSTSTAMSKAYLIFKPDQLHAISSTDKPSATNPQMYIIDPFGFSYGYSTIFAATQTKNNAQSPPVTTPIKQGYNPTFDLWSTAGYAPGGKSTPSSTPAGATTQAAVYSTYWIKNW